MTELRRSYGRAGTALLINTLVVQLSAIIAYLVVRELGVDLNDEQVGMELLNVALVFPVGYVVFQMVLGRNPTPKLAKAPAPEPGEVLCTFAAAVGLLYSGSLVTQTLLAGTETHDYANEMVSEEPLWAALIFTVTLAPIIEEVLFRRLLLDRLLYLGDWSALLISSLFFGLFHTNLYQFLYAALVGLVLGYVRIMTGQMRWNILLHSAINLLCGVLPGYLPEDGPLTTAVDVAVALCMLYVPVYLVTRRPWRQLYPGPMDWFTARDKVKACLTSPGFLVCVAAHLGLSVWLIQGG